MAFNKRRNRMIIILLFLVFIYIGNLYIGYLWIQDEEYMKISIDEIMKGEPVQLSQDDPRIISHIWKNNHLQAPSKDHYNLKTPFHKDPSMGQGQFIRKLLKNKSNGFYIECGALDGETRSNTLFLERHLDWKGLLIEGDPRNYEKMVKKNRKAWLSNTCLAIKPYPHQATFLQRFNQGQIINSDSKIKYRISNRTVTVQCYPLFSLLSALKVSSIDYFSLDVEGSELKVLKTIPFDKVHIKVLSIEFNHTPEGKGHILKFMAAKGFRKVREVINKQGLANDVILVHKSVVPQPPSHKKKFK